MQTNVEHISNRLEFNRTVMNFKKKYKKKLKDLLDKEKNPEIASAFWQDPIIRAYLERSSIEFIDNNPDLVDSFNKNDHENSDHYELKIYEYFPDCIPYRNKRINTQLYMSGGSRMTRDRLSPFFQSLNQFKDIEIVKADDIYNYQENISFRCFTDQKSSTARFVLAPIWNHTHATVCLSILESQTRRILATVFINTIHNTDSYENALRSFSKRNGFFAPSEDRQQNIMNLLNQLFNIDLKQEHTTERKTIISEDQSVALVLDANQPNYYDDEISTLEGKKENEYIYAFYHDKESQQLKLPWFSTKICSPFIDASHNLQTRQEDKSCTLYGITFIQAIINFLNDPEKAERVYALALNAKTEQNTQEKLAMIFQEELKAYLPSYYNTEGKIKSNEEIDAYHAKLRWSLGKNLIPTEPPAIYVPKTSLETQQKRYFQIVNELNRFSSYERSSVFVTQKDQIVLKNLKKQLTTIGSKFFYPGPVDMMNKKVEEIRFKEFKTSCECLLLEADRYFQQKPVLWDLVNTLLKGLIEFVVHLSLLANNQQRRNDINSFFKTDSKRMKEFKEKFVHKTDGILCKIQDDMTKLDAPL